MTQSQIHLQDANELLTSDGFKSNGTWYHGTSSALIGSIKTQGLTRSGDQALNQAIENTMKTIGNSYNQSVEPVFLTQSKELAFYWAQQTVRERGVRFEDDEEPVVLEVRLPGELQSYVKPDVGARTLFMMGGNEQYMSFLTSVYEKSALHFPDIDWMQADRMEFRSKLGMVYIDMDIAPEYLKVL
ncbi:hypothetical protein P7F88_14495 [Vibrio hannami]|uniref:hypothetical protein n=1 Tax=Vibrio hannami TaxID=2717094 RepID=UPI00240EC141|nr:hypothetical protein [Vibrio hannami]MDG3087219.1 hypothetical protein [Vibrio hannami]